MPPSLYFREDGTFVAVQFTDLHWHNGEEDDLRSRALMEAILDAEQPDLCALTGDILSGGACVDPAESWRQAVQPLEERGIPWAAVFGNHDDEGSLDRAALMAVMQSCRMNLSEPGPPEISGVGNYILRLLSPRDGLLSAALYFLDSGSYAHKRIGGYDWIKRDQIAWYLREAHSLALEHAAARPLGTGVPLYLPALAFFHIPLPEYDEVWDLHPCYGYKYESVACPRLNSGFFAALFEAGDVMGTFVGHDHVNDYEGTMHGIRLCYGRAFGYATYGREGFPRGARVIRLREGASDFETWLRLEDGTKVDTQPEHTPKRRVLSD